MDINILFSADFHGNTSQYRSFFHYAIKHHFHAIILGGDIAPKNSEQRSIQGQRTFLQEFFFPLVQEFHLQKHPHHTQILIMMGNDDFKSNYTFLKNHQHLGFQLMDQNFFPLSSDFIIAGYPYVPFTPFQYKDWEKPDIDDGKDFSGIRDIREDGVLSKGEKLIPFNIKKKKFTTSIESDLNKIALKTENKKLILASHAPPYQTPLDIIHNGQHVGSRAVKQFILKHQPLLTLHGHIHETVDVSGHFAHKSNNTTSLSIGNNHLAKQPHVLEIQLLPTLKYKRILLT